MTSRRIRVAAAAVSLAGALALTGCSSDSGSSSKDDGQAGAPESASTDTGGGTAGGTASKALEGSWVATNEGKAVALVVTGTKAGVFSTGGSMCSGTAADEGGMQMIRLKCADGSKTRAVGMVDSVDKAQLKVTWEGALGTETYTKAEGGKLPSGLPTAGLGQ
ncbi:hypothetical protein [Streptomyces zinciresistens]|nr:hypothetical protein [Streptomyces zinciresistens]